MSNKNEKQIQELKRMEPTLQFVLLNMIFIIFAEVLANMCVIFMSSIYYSQTLTMADMYARGSTTELLAFSLIKFSLFILTLYVLNINLLKQLKIKINAEQFILSLSALLIFMLWPISVLGASSMMDSTIVFGLGLPSLAIVILAFGGLLFLLPIDLKITKKK